jgi:hypothetical protein
VACHFIRILPTVDKISAFGLHVIGGLAIKPLSDSLQRYRACIALQLSLQ